MEKNKKIIIFGVGETGQMFCNYFKYDSEYEVCGFTVEKEYIESDTLRGIPIVDFAEVEKVFPPEEYFMFIGIASVNVNTVRKKFYLAAKEKGYKMASYVNSKASIGFEVEIGENSAIMDNTSIQQFAKIGNDVLIFSNNTIGHSSVIGDHTFISSGIAMAGYCKVGESCFFGVNSTIDVGINIGKYSFIGMGAIIGKDVPPYTIFKAEYSKPYKRNTKQLYKLED